MVVMVLKIYELYFALPIQTKLEHRQMSVYIYSLSENAIFIVSYLISIQSFQVATHAKNQDYTAKTFAIIQVYLPI